MVLTAIGQRTYETITDNNSIGSTSAMFPSLACPFLPGVVVQVRAVVTMTKH